MTCASRFLKRLILQFLLICDIFYLNLNKKASPTWRDDLKSYFIKSTTSSTR